MVAVDLEALRAQAERSNGIVEFVPQIGDFVATDDPLFNLYGGARSIDEHDLLFIGRVGSERAMDQDPAFAFRIVVDVALKALSPAINDPTTAVLAMDQLHRMLRTVGKRHLRTDELLDQSGQIRVIFRTPNWDDFVYLAFSEIRSCGSNNLQIVRRMRAMIENLVDTLASIVVRRCSETQSCSIVRSSGSSFTRRNRRSRASLMLRAWAGTPERSGTESNADPA